MGPPSIEMVSMVLSSMPVPPMPVLVGKEVPDEITAMCGDHVVANSHDLWAMLLLSAMERGCEADNAARAETQKRLVEELFAGVWALKEGRGGGEQGAGTEEGRGGEQGAEEAGQDATQEKVYELFSAFTRKNITALSSSSDVRFAPLASVGREDRVHIATCHHAAAQDIVFGTLRTDGGGEKRTAEQFSEFPYAALLMRQFARVAESM